MHIKIGTFWPSAAACGAAAHTQAPKVAAKQQQRKLEVRHSTSDLVHEAAPGPLPVT